MTKTAAPKPTHKFRIALSDEEIEELTGRAKALGLDLETYLRVRLLSPTGLPEPYAFFGLVRRLSAFAQEYEACLKDLAARRNRHKTGPRLDGLKENFAHIVLEWDKRYRLHADDCETENLLNNTAFPKN